MVHMPVITCSERGDAEEILALQKLAYQSEARFYHDYSIPPLTQTPDDIREQYKTHIFLKAVIKNDIIGSVRAYEKDGTCYIGRLIVHPDQQNKGIGKQLMNRIETCFEKAGRFELFTGSKRENSIRFYQKLGYQVFKYEKLNEAVEFAYLEKRLSAGSTG